RFTGCRAGILLLPLQPLIPQTREPPKTTTLEPGFCFLRSNSSSSLLRKSPYSEIKKALYSRQCIRRSLAPTASALPPSVSGLYPGIHLLVMGVQGKQPEPGGATEAASRWISHWAWSFPKKQLAPE